MLWFINLLIWCHITCELREISLDVCQLKLCFIIHGLKQECVDCHPRGEVVLPAE